MRRLLVPGVVTLVMVAVLVGLGTWQWQRLVWKEALLASIAAAEVAPPAPLREPVVALSRVEVRGRFDFSREVLLGLEVRGAVLGAGLVTPLLREGTAPVLVDRGWVPLERGGAVARPEGEVAVVGWVRPAEPGGWFSATDDEVGRRFYSFDPGKIGRAVGLVGVAPFGIVALGPGEPGVLPVPARTMPRPTNNHLGYVITWYGLAVALLGVFGVWARRRMRETR